MPTTIVLLSNGTFDDVVVPETAQETCTMWRHKRLFPHGVYLHKMTHLTHEMSQRLLRLFNVRPNDPVTLSLSLLMDQRCRQGQKLQPNYHELPRFLETQLLFGHLMCLLTVDGCRVINMNEAVLKQILNLEVLTVNTPNMLTPVKMKAASGMIFLTESNNEDDGECRPMDLSPDYVMMKDYYFSPPPSPKKKSMKKPQKNQQLAFAKTKTKPILRFDRSARTLF
jgi:hypothetical protein